VCPSEELETAVQGYFLGRMFTDWKGAPHEDNFVGKSLNKGNFFFFFVLESISSLI